MRVLLALLLALFFTACSGKREYYSPAKFTPSINYSGSLPAYISATTSGGATLENGDFIADTKLIKEYNLAKGYELLSLSDGLALAGNIDGDFYILNQNGNKLYSYKFPQAVVSAQLQGDTLALMLANNTLLIKNIKTNKDIFEYSGEVAIGLDARVPKPLFYANLVIFASLDGRLIAYDLSQNKIVRDSLISTSNYFANAFYLDIKQGNLIAATSKRVIVINSSASKYFDSEIRAVLPYDGGIFIFNKDGSVIKTNFKLEVLAKEYFKFAIITGAVIANDSLYMIEKTGYLFKSDLNLQNIKINKLPPLSNQFSYLDENAFYYGSKYIKLK